MKTLEIVGKDIVALILQSPLTACMGYEDKEKGVRPEVEMFKQIVDGTRKVVAGFGGTSILTSFHRDGTEVSFSVDFKLDMKADELRGEDETDYNQGEIIVRLNWPTHGSLSPETVDKFLALYSEVNQLAKEIESKFGKSPVFILYQTKEQREKGKTIRAKNKLDGIVYALIASHSARMRVGQTKPITGAETLPEGEYTQQMGKKGFKLIKHSLGTVITRLA